MEDKNLMWALNTGDLDEVKAKLVTVRICVFLLLSLRVNHFSDCLAAKLRQSIHRRHGSLVDNSSWGQLKHWNVNVSDVT